MSETVTLETTEIEWRDLCFEGGIPAHPQSFIARAKRDRDRLLADNEAKAREIEELQKASSDFANAISAYVDENSQLRAELSRLKARPTSEEVEELIHFHESQAVAGFGNNDEDADWHGRQAALLRRLAAQSDGWRPNA